MTFEHLAALAAFALVSSITPGPNNLMLMASGANFGFTRTVPHMLGVALGFVAMLVLVGLGLAALFERFPIVVTVLRAICVAYLFVLAWRIATAAPPEEGGSGMPLTFLEAALFQWVNPKAWAMALSTVGVYVPQGSTTALLMAALVFGAINLPCVGTWAAMGLQVRRLIRGRGRLRAFNIVMAGLLVASLAPVLVR